jgi:AcrR family transcriptional regulator
MVQIAFGKQAQAWRQHYADMPQRELFHYLLNVDEFPSVMPHALQRVQACLEQVQSQNLPAHLQPFTYTPQAFAERLQQLHQRLHDQAEAPQPAIATSRLPYLLKQYAPSALLDGCWLQNISLTATNHTPITARLFHIYTQKIGDGEVPQHYGNRFRDLLHSARVPLPEVATRLFNTHADIMDSAFIAPVFQLCLSLFPRVYLPEIIGFTLGHYFNPQDRLLANLQPVLQAQGLDVSYLHPYALDAAPGEQARWLQETVVQYLDGWVGEEEKQAQWQRIWHGLCVHDVINADWQDALQAGLAEPPAPTPQQKMLDLVRAKAVHARNMHRNRKLGGRLINDWFAQEPFDAEGFLAALSASPYVNSQEPGKSALLTRSIEFGGPMFRIFTAQEQTVIAEWIASLATAPASEQQAKSIAQPVSQPVYAAARQDDALDLATYAKCNKRELYYYFVNVDLYPDVLPTARKVAQKFFQAARKTMRKRGLAQHLRLFEYTHEAFEQRVRQIYSMETGAYKAFTAPSSVPREIMLWFVQQYAPFPMVDGSWVQNSARAGLSHSEIGARLFRIYSDEVGNADVVKNHPNVYRKLLAKEGIEMPPTDSPAFPGQKTLRNFVFDLPLLTLSVAMFPKAFLPEIIGVNLAIELSGLGKGYMQIIDELRYWKMDPYFFTLHLTIDNIASGHTAVAMETVHLYLDQILATQGQAAMQREWERIWVGYLAFRRNMDRFDSTLERQAALRYLLPLAKQNLKRNKANKYKPAAVG